MKYKPVFYGDVILHCSYEVFISQIIRFARVSFHANYVNYSRDKF